MSRGCQCEHGSGQRQCDSHVDHSLMTHRLAPDAACVAPPNGQTCRFAVNFNKAAPPLPRFDGADPVLAYHRRRDCPAMQQMYLLDRGAVSIFQLSVVTSALPARFAIPISAAIASRRERAHHDCNTTGPRRSVRLEKVNGARKGFSNAGFESIPEKRRSLA